MGGATKGDYNKMSHRQDYTMGGAAKGDYRGNEKRGN